MYKNMVTMTSLAMVALGAAMVVVTIARAGFGVGILLGVLFMGAGGGRLWMLHRRIR